MYTDRYITTAGTTNLHMQITKHSACMHLGKLLGAIQNISIAFKTCTNFIATNIFVEQ